MNKYAILYNPGHNRVYFKSSLKLAESEFFILSREMLSRPVNIANTRVAGLDYLTFETGGGLTPSDIGIISNLSFIYALYEIIDVGGTLCLGPIERSCPRFIDESLSSILKYTGKTNEIFTRMMLNVALYSIQYEPTEPVRLLDPVAGKGTTLFEGLIRGFDVYGVEIGDKTVAEACQYLKKFLETERYKHLFETQRISGAKKSFISKKYAFEIAKSKDDLKSDGRRRFEFISGNSAHACAYYKKNFFDLIVGDLPYGVQHGNVTNQKQSSLTRNPSELLGACLPAWSGALKPGGSIVLAWNINVLPRADAVRLLGGGGLIVLDDPAYRGFAHRVDQSITRDIIAARKPRA